MKNGVIRAVGFLLLCSVLFIFFTLTLTACQGEQAVKVKPCLPKPQYTALQNKKPQQVRYLLRDGSLSVVLDPSGMAVLEGANLYILHDMLTGEPRCIIQRRAGGEKQDSLEEAVYDINGKLLLDWQPAHYLYVVGSLLVADYSDSRHGPFMMMIGTGATAVDLETGETFTDAPYELSAVPDYSGQVYGPGRSQTRYLSGDVYRDGEFCSALYDEGLRELAVFNRDTGGYFASYTWYGFDISPTAKNGMSTVYNAADGSVVLRGKVRLCKYMDVLLVGEVAITPRGELLRADEIGATDWYADLLYEEPRYERQRYCDEELVIREKRNTYGQDDMYFLFYNTGPGNTSKIVASYYLTLIPIRATPAAKATGFLGVNQSGTLVLLDRQGQKLATDTRHNYGWVDELKPGVYVASYRDDVEGSVLRTGNVDGFIAVDETLTPVFELDAAQMLTALGADSTGPIRLAVSVYYGSAAWSGRDYYQANDSLTALPRNPWHTPYSLLVGYTHPQTGQTVYDIYDTSFNRLFTGLSGIFGLREDRLLLRQGFRVGMMDYDGNWLYSTSAFNSWED